ncbi:hypothetical protein DYB34_002749, partial [Aphanomyces astaci]
ELTRALLHRDFGITTWHVPLNRLCPPLPNRLNYIHWIEDLILFSQSSYVSTEDAPIWGVDIGTGASVIYPLLGHSLNQWRFLATDVDAESIEYAAANLRSNHLEHVIHLETVADGHDAAILPTASIQRRCRHDGPVLFTMCNPPFFDSIDQADTNPRTACTGSASEMTTPGGEVAFVTRMIQDSLLLTSQVRWYTSLIGRKSSLRPLLAILRSHGIPNMRTTEFLQGRTTRWGLAWSFTTDGSTTPNEVLSFDTLSQKKSYDTHGHKVLAKRREAKRRQALTFHLPQSFPAVSTGHCASMDDVHRRILDSAALLESAEEAQDMSEHAHNQAADDLESPVEEQHDDVKRPQVDLTEVGGGETTKHGDTEPAEPASVDHHVHVNDNDATVDNAPTPLNSSSSPSVPVDAWEEGEVEEEVPYVKPTTATSHTSASLDPVDETELGPSVAAAGILAQAPPGTLTPLLEYQQGYHGVSYESTSTQLPKVVIRDPSKSIKTTLNAVFALPEHTIGDTTLIVSPMPPPVDPTLVEQLRQTYEGTGVHLSNVMHGMTEAPSRRTTNDTLEEAAEVEEDEGSTADGVEAGAVASLAGAAEGTAFETAAEVAAADVATLEDAAADGATLEDEAADAATLEDAAEDGATLADAVAGVEGVGSEADGAVVEVEGSLVEVVGDLESTAGEAGLGILLLSQHMAAVVVLLTMHPLPDPTTRHRTLPIMNHTNHMEGMAPPDRKDPTTALVRMTPRRRRLRTDIVRVDMTRTSK